MTSRCKRQCALSPYKLTHVSWRRSVEESGIITGLGDARSVVELEHGKHDKKKDWEMQRKPNLIQ